MAVLLTASGRAQNLLSNGSLESARRYPGDNATLTIRSGTDIDHWTVGGSGLLYIGKLVTASDGQRSASLNFGGPGSIEQNFPSLAGQRYRLTFDHSAFVTSNGSGARPTSVKAAVLSGTNEIAGAQFTYDGTGKTLPDVGWGSGRLEFTGTGGVLTVRLTSLHTTNGGALVDNIGLQPGSPDDGGGWILDGQLVFRANFAATTPVAEGKQVELDGTAFGAEPIAYQWYWKRNSSSSPTVLMGETGPTLRADVSNNGNQFFVVAANNLGTATNLTTTSIIRPPQIATQPEEERVSVGQNLQIGPRSFVGSVPDGFQWYKNGEIVAGATEQYFQKTAALSDAGDYFVEVTNIAGKTNSVTVPVRVFEGPVPAWIRDRNRPPAGMAAQEGGNLTIVFNAEGTFPLTYYWYSSANLLSTGNTGAYTKSNAQIADSGAYHCVVSNATGVVTSSVVNVTIYPPQTAPQLASTAFSTNAPEGGSMTLSFTLTRGDHLNYQWFFRPNGVLNGFGDPIPGAVNPELTLSSIKPSDAGTYYFNATNFVGSVMGQVMLSVVAKPVVRAVSGFEGAAGSLVNLGASVDVFSPNLSYQWLFNGEPIVGATASQYSFSLSATTAGSYAVRVTNVAGSTTSEPGRVLVREITPAGRKFNLVADSTVAAPGRPGQVLRVVGDAHLRVPTVTFQSTTNFPDVGGLYRWAAGNVEKVVDLNDTLPGMSAKPTILDGVSAEENGIILFRGTATNSAPVKEGLYQWKAGVITPVVTDQNDMPGHPGLRFKRFGYVTQAGGKAAFLGFDEKAAVFEPGGIRGVYVWDGVTLARWVDSTGGLPAGNGTWHGNSSQVGFDGTRLAVWLADRPATEGQFNGIFTSVNGSPLQKIAFTGDPIPGGLGVFATFNSPPLVQEGKVLFLGQTENFNENFLMEFADGALRVLARSGSAPAGGSAFGTIQYGFDYLRDGSVLFSASGPGMKSGIYRVKDGVITEELTSLNTLDGRLIRFVSLYDIDGDDCLITASFDGTRFGLYTTVGSDTAGLPPRLTTARSATGLRIDWTGPGVLQGSVDLFLPWEDLSATSGDEIPFSSSQRFFRVRRP